MSVFDTLWSLPGPLAFLDRCVDALREGTSLVIVTRRETPGGLWTALVERWLDRGGGGRCARVDVDAASAAEALSRHLPGGDPASPLCARLHRARDGPARRHRWARRNARRSAGRCCATRHRDRIGRAVRPAEARPRLVLQVSEGPHLPREDIALRLFRCKRNLTPLDLRLYAAVRVHARREGPGAARACELKSALVAEWASARPEQVDALVDATLEVLLDADHMATRLEIGPAAARRAAWRAQVQIVYPLIEESRSQLIETHAAHLRLPWNAWDGRDLVEPLDHEVGHLIERLRGCGSTLAEELRTLRTWRNELAHLRPLYPDHFRRSCTRELLDPFAA